MWRRGGGFEPPEQLPAQRFSRPPDSTTLAPLRVTPRVGGWGLSVGVSLSLYPNPHPLAPDPCFVGGEAGIRTRAAPFGADSLSRRAPSATRSPLRITTGVRGWGGRVQEPIHHHFRSEERR